jgi:DNA/RNA-binding domain of Phe-tRNA-synthetase-like protein
MTFAVTDEMRAILRPAVLWFEGAVIVERAAALDAPLASAEALVRMDASGGRAHEHVDAVRAMYRSVGLDPTKTRPSSEALLRRVRKGDALPRINCMVDVCNWCSLEFQLPYGLYDTAHVRGGRVDVRRGRDDEAYQGIRKDVVHVSGRITLADADGPFGNPTSDSARTMVTTETTSVMVVVFAPASTAGARLATVLEITSARVKEFTRAREMARQIVV